MLVIFATALLLSMPRPNLVVAFKPYLSAFGSLQSSSVTSLRIVSLNFGKHVQK